MKTIKTATVLAAMCLAVFAGSARAQETVIVKVPFKFMMRGQEFSAGRYEINREGNMLAVRGLDNGGGGFALATPADGRDPAGDRPALVFTRSENEYELSEIWENDTEGLTVPEPSAPSHHAKARDVAPDAPIVVPASSSR
jgi:hypothetical protein